MFFSYIKWTAKGQWEWWTWSFLLEWRGNTRTNTPTKKTSKLNNESKNKKKSHWSNDSRGIKTKGELTWDTKKNIVLFILLKFFIITS